MGVQGLAYLVADVADPAAWRRFVAQILGAQIDEVDGGLAVRLDERAVRLLLRPDATDGPVVAGWEVTDEAAARALVERAGVNASAGSPAEAARRGVTGFVGLEDPAGNLLELCWGPIEAAAPFVGARPHGGFRTGALGLGHVVWSMPSADAAMAFYQDVLGFRPSDYATVPGRLFFFHANPRHHSLALGELGFTGLHHLMLEVLDFDDLGRAYDAALESDWQIISSLGRHSNDHVTSFYVRTPSNWAVEVGWGGLLILDEEAWEVRELAEGPSLWGHERTWVGEEMKVRQRELRHVAADRNLRAPLHVPAGTALDVEGLPPH
jgi:2,3-dihydroxybiphenyl 1,2-dioxygenase